MPLLDCDVIYVLYKLSITYYMFFWENAQKKKKTLKLCRTQYIYTYIYIRFFLITDFVKLLRTLCFCIKNLDFLKQNNHTASLIPALHLTKQIKYPIY